MKNQNNQKNRMTEKEFKRFEIQRQLIMITVPVLYQYYLDDVDDIRKDVTSKIGMTSFKDTEDEVRAYIAAGYPESGEFYEKMKKAAKKRFREDNKKANGDGEHKPDFKNILLLGRIDENGNLKFFTDHDIHNIIKAHGYDYVNLHELDPRLSDNTREWFPSCITPEVVKRIHDEYIKNEKNLKDIIPDLITAYLPVLRDEQVNAINTAEQTFFADNLPCCVWDCKCRFGKTLTSLQLIKQNHDKIKIVKVITSRPETLNNFRNDNLRLGIKDYALMYQRCDESNVDFEKRLKNAVDNGKNVIILKGLQDIRGSKEVGGDFEKNSVFFNIKTDLLIIDECDEATGTDLGRTTLCKLIQKDHTKVLCMTGTAFKVPKILSNLGFDKDQITTYTWTYEDEQNAKNNWDYSRGSNPYKDMPKIEYYGISLNAFLKISGFCSPTEFFRVENEKFVHEEYVRTFIENFIKCGIWKAHNMNHDVVAKDYPFGLGFKHLLVYVDQVEIANCLERLINEINTGIEVVNIAGSSTSKDKNSKTNNSKEYIKRVQYAVSHKGNTVTITCGRGTRGWTVPKWDAVCFLTGSDTGETSISSYFQTAYRGQSNCDGKEVCAVFDFAPNRLLSNIDGYVSYSAKVKGIPTSEAGRSFINNVSCELFNESGLVKLNDYEDIERECRASQTAEFNDGCVRTAINESTLRFIDRNLLSGLISSKISNGNGKNSNGVKTPAYKLNTNEQVAIERENVSNNSEKKNSNNNKNVEKDEKDDEYNNVIETGKLLISNLKWMIAGHLFKPENFDELLDAITDNEWEGFMQYNLGDKFNKDFVKKKWIPLLNEGVFFDSMKIKKNEFEEYQKNGGCKDFNKFMDWIRWLGKPENDITFCKINLID